MQFYVSVAHLEKYSAIFFRDVCDIQLRPFIYLSSLQQDNKPLLDKRKYLQPKTHLGLKCWSVSFDNNNSLAGYTERKTVELSYHRTAGLFLYVRKLCVVSLCPFSWWNIFILDVLGVSGLKSPKVALTLGVYEKWLCKDSVYTHWYSTLSFSIFGPFTSSTSLEVTFLNHEVKKWSEISILVALQLFRFLGDKVSRQWDTIQRNKNMFQSVACRQFCD